MRATVSPPDKDRLFAVAEGQQGYFTRAQAEEAGFARSTHSYHVKAGNWVREHRGIYRLKRFPVGEEGQLVLWSLWSRNRNGEPQGVYSHATALALKELSDANPAKLHMTVPPGFRRSGTLPPVLVLHKAKLEPSEIMRERGYSLTRPMRSILDCAVSGDADPGQLGQALDEGLRRGLITRAEVRETARRSGVPPWLVEMLEKLG